MGRTRASHRNNINLHKECMNILAAAVTIITTLISPICSIAHDASVAHTSLEDKDPLIQHIYWQVANKIDHLEDLPGVKDLPKIVTLIHAFKPGLKERWTKLVQQGALVVEETDKEGRPYTIYLRAIVEDVLSSLLKKGQIKSLKGVIHTPMIATPFCTAGNISKNLVIPTIEKDVLRLGTVLCRTVIAREYLARGGDLDIVYPKYGKPRSPEQLKIYKEALKKYSPHLRDRPLDCISIPKDLVGAYYIFKNLIGKEFAFAVQAPQASDTPEKNIFGLWLDEFFPSTSVYKRFLAVEEFMQKREFLESGELFFYKRHRYAK